MEATSEGNSQRLMGAMEMEMGTLLQDGTEEKWEAISDLDAFFSRVYDYFNERGLRCIITARIINLLTLLFTITRASPVESGPPEASASMPAPEALRTGSGPGFPRRGPSSANQPLGPRWPSKQALTVLLATGSPSSCST